MSKTSLYYLSSLQYVEELESFVVEDYIVELGIKGHCLLEWKKDEL